GLSWTVEELKALLMNTATDDIYTEANKTGIKYAPARVGAGRVNVANALLSNVIAYNADETGAVSLSFDTPEITTTTTLTKTVTVNNKGSVLASFNLSYTPYTTIPGVNYSFPDGSAVSVGANSVATFRVQLTANPALMENTRDSTVAATQNGYARAWLSEASGMIALTPTSGMTQTLRLPLYAAPRPASLMGTSQTTLNLTALTGNSSLNLTGQGINTGSSYPTSSVSLVTALELAGSRSPSPGLTVTKSADLQYVGVTSDLKAQLAAGNPVISTTLYFGISTYGNWTAPATGVTFKIFIDTNLDGKEEYELSNSRQSNIIQIQGIANTLKTDAFYSSLFVKGTYATSFEGPLNGLSPANYSTATFNNNVVVLPVKAASLGLATTNARFSYWIESYSLNDTSGNPVSTLGSFTYDYTNPGLSFSSATNVSGSQFGIPTYFDLPGQTVPVAYDYRNFKRNRSQGILLLRYHNTTGQQAQVVPVLGGTIPCSQPQLVTLSEDMGDDVCGSLSYAIKDGLASVSPKVTITFNVPGNVISVTASLPPISTTNPVKTLAFDALCNIAVPGGRGLPTVQIKSAPAASQIITSGLVLKSSGNTIKGLALTGFSGYALDIESNNNAVVCSALVNSGGGIQLGTTSSVGVAGVSANSNRLGLADGSSLGVPGSASGDIISGNSGSGILVNQGVGNTAYYNLTTLDLYGLPILPPNKGGSISVKPGGQLRFGVGNIFTASRKV
ncbi:MAG: hypothetical protein WCS37_20035, partial [Chloroflexota bacterium]